VGLLLGSAVGLHQVWRSMRPYLALLAHRDPAHRIRWSQEFWPHQWRLAFSWGCGVLMFHTFVPIIFHLQGPEQAGQAGMLLQAFNLVNTFSMVWLTTRQPQFGAAWSRHDTATVRAIHGAVTRLSLATASVLGLLGTLALWQLHRWMPEWAQRFGTLDAAIPLFFACVLLQIANVDTAAIRFSKREPFIATSAACAVALVGANYLLAPLGVAAVFTGFAGIVSLMLVPWTTLIYRKEVRRAAGA
jgi:hypothetical protein